MAGNLFEDVLQTIENWNPKDQYTTETKYRDDLLLFLRQRLNQSESSIFSSPLWNSSNSRQHLIKKEAGRSLADIGIDNKIGIELKRNLKRKSQINRLVGQVVDYLDGYSHVIIVLCGQPEQEAVEVLKHNLRRIIQAAATLYEQEKLIKIVSKDQI
ncbi:MAG: hypothetical protein NWF03_05520 [Candidatus Bathyarchaeota archaeon]|nr:hypothetical protein [Candidatus Bathyarchaeota archaeon]